MVHLEVPVNNLTLQHLELKDELMAVFENSLKNSSFINGSENNKFEADFGRCIGLRGDNVIGAANGTMSLYAALKVLGISKGDEVIVPAHTWISTASAVVECGAIPIFADIDFDTCNISTKSVANLITGKTRACIAVHLYGLPCDLSELDRLCSGAGIHLLEDCAQAHLAEYREKPVGTIGKAGCFSFYPGKNLGALGDAGCVVSTDDELAKKIRMYLNHGQFRKHSHEFWGTNGRLDSIQAAFLKVKLKKLSVWTDRRIAIADQYSSNLIGLDNVKLPSVTSDRKHVYHQYTIRTERRDQLKDYLFQRGIQTLVNYPRSLDMLPFVKKSRFECRSAQLHSKHLLCLPIFPELTDQQINHVSESICDFYKEG